HGDVGAGAHLPDGAPPFLRRERVEIVGDLFLALPQRVGGIAILAVEAAAGHDQHARLRGDRAQRVDAPPELQPASSDDTAYTIVGARLPYSRHQIEVLVERQRRVAS